MRPATRARSRRAEGAEPRLPPARGERPRCLLATRHAETGLLGTLRAVLRRELPGIEFVLEADGAPPDSVWVCAYDPGDTRFVAELRRRHPRARLLVTRCGGSGWDREALAAGADAAAPWPLPLGELERHLSRPRAG